MITKSDTAVEMKRILSLDPSLRAYGWAIIEEDILACGCIETESFKDELTSLSDNKRIDILANELKRIIETWKPELIIFENPVGSKSSRANQALAYAKAITIGAAIFSGIAYEPIRAKSVKKALTGNSDADKETILELVTKMYPSFATLTTKWSKARKLAASDAAAVYIGYTSLQ